MTNSLADKIVLVTGAAGAIGRAVMSAVTAAGGRPIGTDLSSGLAAVRKLDVTQEGEWVHLIADIKQDSGRLDGLVNCAGIATLGSIEETEFATWRRVLAVNLDGTFLGCKHAFPLLRQRGGSIVNVSSVSGLVGGHNLAAYNAAKGGVRLLTKSVALHGARGEPKVRCNSIHPAFIEGPMVDAIADAAKDAGGARATMARSIPLGRLGTPKEVADLIVYLLSDESAFVTGAEFVIDGGLTAR